MANGESVLIIGGGGREDALRQAMEASPETGRIVVNANAAEGLGAFAVTEKPFVVIGPEAPLVAGVADDLRREGYTVFGANQTAARYEADKAHAVAMMQRAGIPHPRTVIARDAATARHYVEGHPADHYVIKANGLAAGKGVVLPGSKEEARTVVEEMLAGGYDGAGQAVINFQKRHHGAEFSAMVVIGEGDEHVILPLSQDHKRLGEGDTGPNTGGMGAYAPLPASIISAEQYDMVEAMAAASLEGMRAAGTPYGRGVLYVGGMLSEQFDGKPVVIEYNCRFGDPETQVLMPMLQAAGVDVYRLLRSAAEGDLEVPKGIDFRHLSLSALTVCLASAGYPAGKHVGDEIWGLGNDYEGVTIQQAAVKDGKTNGGRVLYATATGETIDQAAARAYDAIDVDRLGPDSGRVGFAGMQFRRDIGHLARRLA